MGSSGVITATGEGEFLLGGYFTVEEVHAIITVPSTQLEYRSVNQPRRVMHCGWVALGHNFNGGASSFGNPSTVTALNYIEFEDQWIIPRWPANWYFERMFWRMDPGVTCTLEATWP